MKDDVYSRRILLTAFCIMAEFIFFAASALAQLPTATVLGTVKDSSGAVVAGANVTLHNLETGLERTAVSDAAGQYRAAALSVGRYSIAATHSGFKTQTQSGIVLTVSQEAVVDFTLQVGATTEQIEVTTEAPLVNTTSSSLGGLVNEQRISELPLNGRNFVDLSLLQVGVTRQANVGQTAGMGGVWYSSNGAPPRSNSYLLDGASMSNLFGATASSVAATTLGVEGIREYKVVTNSFSAEYGITMGSQMTIASKGGTNQFHGSAFEYLRNSAMDAANYFDPTPVVSPGSRIAPLRRNQFGGALGGPIQHDKTFFFGTYEALRERAGITNILNVIPANCFNAATHQILTAANPCATASAGNAAAVVQPIANLFGKFAYPNLPSLTPGRPADRFGWIFNQPTSENYGQMRIDQNFSAADTFFGRYTIDDTQTTHATGLYPAFHNPWSSRSQFLTLSENHVFSPSLLNTARASFSRTNLQTNSLSGISNATYPGTSLVCAANYTPNCLQIGSVAVSGLSAFSPDVSSPSDEKQNIFSFSDDAFLSRGRHSLKLGTLINHYQQDIFQLFQYVGGLTFSNVPNFLAGRALQYNLEDPNRSNENKYITYNSLGFYGQDDVRLGRVTLNLGLRYEFITVPREVHGVESALLNPTTTDTPNSAVLGPMFKNPSLHNFSPRLGFAWDIFGTGKTSLRAGFARVYDLGNIGSAVVQDAIGTPPFSQQIVVANPATLTLPLPIAGGGPPLIRTINYNIGQPTMLQYNLSIEQQMPGQMALTVAYAGSRGSNLWQVGDANPRTPATRNPETWAVNVTNGLASGKSPRLNPNLGSIVYLNTAGDSWYNSLQVSLEKRLSHGFQFQSSYTWSKSLDDTQGQLPNDTNGTYPLFASDPFNLMVDKGPSSFDIAQNWHFNLIYRVPDLSRSAALGKLVNGWGMSGIVGIQSGYPFSPLLANDQSGAGVNGGGASINRPDRAANFNAGSVITGSIAHWFDPSMFALPAAGTLGSVSRGLLRGPALANLDWSFTKDTGLRYLGEQGRLQFRAEFFNILNHPNFAVPAVLNPFAPTAGQISSTVPGTDSRRVQLALKLLF